MKPEEREVWFAMRVTYRREMKARDILDAAGMRCFIPMQYRIIQGVRKRRVLVPIIRSLLFVRCLPSRLQSLKNEGRMPYLQYMTDRRSGKKIIVPDRQMEEFIAVTADYSEYLLYYKPEELDLKRGCRVRITGGQFGGYEGRYMRVKGARDKRVVIAIPGVLAVVLCTLPPELIEVIPEASPDQTENRTNHDHSR